MTSVSDFTIYSCSGYDVICIQERWFKDYGLTLLASGNQPSVNNRWVIPYCYRNAYDHKCRPARTTSGAGVIDHSVMSCYSNNTNRFTPKQNKIVYAPKVQRSTECPQVVPQPLDSQLCHTNLTYNKEPRKPCGRSDQHEGQSYFSFDRALAGRLASFH